MTQKLADSLMVNSFKCQRICISTFGEAVPRDLLTNDGGEVPIPVLVFPKIAAPLQNAIPLPDDQ